jgi:hypothetical protein
MLRINFFPESDKQTYIKAAKEYTQIWEKDGQKIIDLIEKYSGLKFITTEINGVTFEGMSYSYPLRMKSSYSSERKEAELVHELIHRLLIDHHFWFPEETLTEESHKVVDLILFDIWTGLLGEEIAVAQKDVEISYGDPAYKSAWDLSLSFSKEERSTEFEKLKSKYINKEPKPWIE